MIDFLKYRYICFGLSAVMIIAGIAAAVMHLQKGENVFEYHIDFVGGTELTAKFESPLKIDAVRNVAKAAGWEDLTVQSIGTADESGSFSEFIIRMPESAAKGGGLDQRFKSDVDGILKNNSIEIREVSHVGAEVGQDIQWNSIVAILLSLLIILGYVAIRSRYEYAVGAVVAIAHDMLAVIIVFLLLREQISVHVLAAILAILGYSLNDTLVIFSAVRKNLTKARGQSKEEIVNQSINKTMRRTLFTSITTLLAVLSIFFLGGQSLYGFSLAMLVGVIAGTYSSVYIASPVMLAVSTNNTQK
jgi:preprotein translocase subunit SecF